MIAAPVVEVEDVSFSYGHERVLEDVSMTIAPGEFVGLIGPNGSGKTTLLQLILGMFAPDRGTVRLFGEPATRFEDGSRLGYVSQRATDRNAAMPVTVEEVVTMGRFAGRRGQRLTEADHAVVDEAMETVHVADLRDARIDQLSGGQRQRAFIARALASRADFLALDEPTVGLDAGANDDFYDLLGRLNDEGITVLLIEHDVDIITSHVDTVACINRTLHYHGGAVEFLESEALREAYGASHGILHHEHP